jgi:ABC-type phosphate transport system auxiliary subunit
MKDSIEIRNKLQHINDDIQQNQQMKTHDIHFIKTQLERYNNDLRTIQSESNLLDRLMEESNTTITDSITNINIFFVVECRIIQNLVDTIENKVY